MSRTTSQQAVSMATLQHSMNGALAPNAAEPDALQKALDAAHENAALRLRRAAERLAAVVPADGVLFSALWRPAGLRPVTLILLWPCWLLELEPGSGEIIAETHVANMHALRPDAAAFLVGCKAGKPLLSVAYSVAQSGRQRADIDVAGVVRVHGTKTQGLLAESEPGQPDVLRAGFQTLNAADLAPRFT